MARRRNGEGTLPRQRADGRWFSDIRSTDDYATATITAKVYSHVSPEVSREALEVLGGAVG